MAQIGKVSIELEAKIAKLESDLKKAATGLEREMSKMRHMTQKSMSQISSTTEAAGKKVESSVARMSNGMKNAFNVAVILTAVKGFQRLADEYSNVSARVKLAAGSHANFEKSMESVLKVSLSTYQSLDATARLTQKISQGLQSTGISAKDAFSKAIELTEVFNKALVVSGAGTIQAQSAMLQFSQAISKGKLDGDEFRSVMETNGAFMALLANTLGVTTGALYKLREEGKLTTDVLFAVTQNTKQLDEQFAAFPLTIARASENFKSAFTVFLGQSDQAIGASRTLAEAIKLIADNLSLIANVTIGAAGILAVAKAIGAISAAAITARNAIGAMAASNAIWAEQRVAIVASAQASAQASAAKSVEIARTLEVIAVVRQETIAKLASANADILAQKATLSRVASMATLPMTIRLQEQATLALAAAQARSAALMGPLAVLGKQEANLRIQLIGAAAQQVVAMSSLSAANSSLVKAQTATVVSMASLRAAGAGLFAMLGGWPVALAAAAVGFVYLISQADEATDAAIEQANAMEAAGQKAAAASKYTKDAEVAAYAESIAASQKKLEAARALVASYEELKAASQNTITPIHQYSLALQVVGNQSERAEADIKLLSGSVRENSIALAEMTNGEAKIKSFLASFERISHINDLLQFMGLQAREAADAINVLSAAGTAKDFVEDLQKENRQLLEKIVNIRGGIAAVNAMKLAEMDLSKMSAKERKEMEKSIEANNALTKELKLTEDAERAKSRALKDSAKETKKNAEELKQLAKAQADASREARKLAAELEGPLAESWQHMQNEIENLQEAYAEGKIKIDAYVIAVRALVGMHLQEVDAANQAAAAQAHKNDILARTREAHAKEAAGLGLTARAAFVYAEMMRAADTAIEQFQAKQRKSPDLSKEEKEGIEASAAALYDMGIAAENAAETAAKFEDMWVQAGHGAADALGEFFVSAFSLTGDFENAWEDLGDALVDIIKQSVAEMISEFFKLQIINPMLNSLFQGFGGAVLPTAQGGGNWMSSIMSMFGGGTGTTGASSGSGWMSSLMGMFGMGGGFTAAGAGGLAPIFSGSTLLGGATTTATSGLTGLGGTTGAAGGGFSMSTVMSAVPWAALIAIGISMNNSAYANGWRTNGGTTMLPNGQSVTGGGSPSWMDGRLSDNLLQSLGFSSSTASMLSGSALHTRLFGRSMPQIRSGEGTFNFGDNEGGQSYRTVERGGVFRSDRWRTTSGDLTEEAQEAFEAMYAAIRQTMREAAAMLQGEAPEMIAASMRVVQEFDSKGKVTATKYFVDILGRSWEEATEEAASQRIHAEAMIATIDSILGTTASAATAALEPVAEAIGAGVGDVVHRVGDAVDQIVKTTGVVGEASAIAERWRGSAEDLLAGAQFLLAAATDMQAGVGLLGDGGTLTEITELIEELQNSGESLVDTYSRVAQSTNLLTDAMDLQGTALDLTREEFVRFATDITEAAGGIERARSLWQGYFDMFFTEQERAELAIARAQASANREGESIGLSADSYRGRSGLAQFREDFERAQIAGLTAEATVEWLEFGNALAQLVMAQESYTATVIETTEAVTELAAVNGGLAAFMQGIEASISGFGNEGPDFGQMFSELNAEFALIIKDAIAIGASEEDIGRIRELYQMRYNAILEEQRASLEAMAQASRDLAYSVLELNVMAQNGGGLPSYLQTLGRIRGEYDSHVERLNELARAAGRAGASEEELAAASAWLASAMAAAVQELVNAGRSLVQQLYGGGGGSSEGGGANTFFGPENTGISEINEAVEDRYARELALLEDIQDYLDSLSLSALSPLTPEERLLEAQSQYEDLLRRAMAGDLDALAELQEAANTYLGEAQSYYGGVGAYSGIYDSVRAALQGLVDRGPLNEPLPGGVQPVSGAGGGPVIVDPGSGFDEQAARDRLALAQELATVMRDIMLLTGDSLLEVSEQLGLDLRALVGDLGADLDELTVETTLALVDIADSLGVSLEELASSVGFTLGELADQNSLISEALAATINELPSDIAANLNAHLAAIRAAGAMGSTQEMTAYMNTLPADIRDALDEFFPDVVTDEEQMFNAIIDTAASTLATKLATEATATATAASAADSAAIRGVLFGPIYSRLQEILNESALSNLWLGTIAGLLGFVPPPPPEAPGVAVPEPDYSLLDRDEEDAQSAAILAELKAMRGQITNVITAGNQTGKESLEIQRQTKRVLETPLRRGQ